MKTLAFVYLITVTGSLCAQLAPPLKILDDECLANATAACLAETKNFRDYVGANENGNNHNLTCPEGYIYLTHVWEGLGKAQANVYGEIPPGGCFLMADGPGLLYRREFCHEQVRASPPAQCFRTIEFDALINILRNDLRILANQMCKANSSDANKCDANLPLPK